VYEDDYVMPGKEKGYTRIKEKEPNEDSLRAAYVQAARFIELTENGRISLLQIYIAVLTASITGGAVIFAYGYGKIKLTTISIPLAVILIFLTILSITLYFIFLRWDASYAYNTAMLDWISERLSLARKMPTTKIKDLSKRYADLNKRYKRFLWIIPLPKRMLLPEWALIDEVYGPLIPPSSIQVHVWFNRFMLICIGGSLSFSILLVLYVVFNRPVNVMILPELLILFGVYYIVIGYGERLRKKVEDEVNMFKEFRKPERTKTSGLEQIPSFPKKHEKFISVLDLIVIISSFSGAMINLLGWIEFSYIVAILLILAVGLRVLYHFYVPEKEKMIYMIYYIIRVTDGISTDELLKITGLKSDKLLKITDELARAELEFPIYREGDLWKAKEKHS
jgi:hypothetical protein